MKLEYENYLQQRQRWPTEGRHIMAQFDEQSIVVYQAYRPDIGHYATEHQRFGGPWSFDRMSWIKPNFLWMMYRSGWGQKSGQEVVLAIRLRRDGFDRILEEAVHSSYVPEVYGERKQWKQRVVRSDVRLQWDPDHDPHGNKVGRRAIQLGLRRRVLADYANDWCLGIADISDQVREQRQRLLDGGPAALQTPTERVYPVTSTTVANHLGLADWHE